MNIGWIDFSEKDRQRSLDIINLLTEPSSLDELGLGIVRDAFSNYFFPGISTIQTRAKYFLITPYIFHDVCKKTKQTSIYKILEEIDSLEKECAIIMKDACDTSEETKGIIGVSIIPEKWVVSKPHSIYWTGLRKFGFLRKDLSKQDCIKIAIEQHDNKSKSKKMGCFSDKDSESADDSDANNGSLESLWKLDTYKDDWKENLTIRLTEDEANLLSRQITQELDESLLKHIITNHLDIQQFNTFSQLSKRIYQDVSEEMKKMLDLANDFNELVYAARIWYNKALFDDERYLSSWDEMKDDFYKVLDRFNLEDLFNNPLLNISKDYLTKQFLEKLIEAFKTDTNKIELLLVNREKSLKGEARAKLNHKSEYVSTQWVGGKRLNFRLAAVKRIINDICEGKTND